MLVVVVCVLSMCHGVFQVAAEKHAFSAVMGAGGEGTILRPSGAAGDTHDENADPLGSPRRVCYPPPFGTGWVSGTGYPLVGMKRVGIGYRVS